jgi:signal transduction histidine kinase
MVIKRDPSKLLQLGFLGLLVVSLAQASYWIYDHVTHTRDVQRQIHELYTADAELLTAAHSGSDPQSLGRLLPHIETDPASGQARVRPAALAELDREADVRVNRFLWEGGFFLAVLLGGLTVLTRTIRHDAELRRRQQNFLAAVSHEFKSPLASIRLAAETLVLRAGEAESRRLGQRILEDDERLLRMIENLLDTTRLEEVGHVLAPESVRLADVAASCVEAIAERARHNAITIECDIEGEIALFADREALETILRNLLDNAINACVAGGGARVELSAHREAAQIRIAVRDDGAGFPPEDAKMIFEKFYRAGDELRRTTPGSGLGLYIVRRLVELSGARIAAASDGPGSGATFTLCWPIKDEA